MIKMWEVISDELFDTVQVGDSDRTMHFFGVPQGSRTEHDVEKTPAETNMVYANRLPPQQTLIVTGFRIEAVLDRGVTGRSIMAFFLRPAVVHFYIGSKPYLTRPLRVFALAPVVLGEESALCISGGEDVFGLHIEFAEVEDPMSLQRVRATLEGKLRRPVC